MGSNFHKKESETLSEYSGSGQGNYRNVTPTLIQCIPQNYILKL